MYDISVKMARNIWVKCKKALRYNVQCIVSSNTYASTINDKRVFIFKQGDYESLKEIVENVKLDCPREIKFEEKKIILVICCKYLK